MDSDLPLTLVNKWHDYALERGGGGSIVTKVRYYLGKFGPFEASFPKDPDVTEIERVVRDKRAELQRVLRA